MKVNDRIKKLIGLTKNSGTLNDLQVGDEISEAQLNIIRFDGTNGYMKGEFDTDHPTEKVYKQYVGQQAWQMAFKMADQANIEIYTKDINGVFSVCEREKTTGQTRHRKFVRSVPVLAQHDYSSFPKNEEVKPIRVKRSRKKGSKTPPNTKYVGRPTRWGNPFKVGAAAPDILDQMYEGVGKIQFDKNEGRMVEHCPSYLDTLHQLKYLQRGHIIENKEAATKLFKEYIEWLKDKHPEQYEELIEPIKGKNLSCWCRLDEPCHADILLEFANQ